MSLWRLFDIVDELGRTEPALLSLDLSVFRRPANFPAKRFEVSLALSPLFLLDGISEFAVRELIPQPFHRRKVRRRNVLHVGKVHEIPTFRLRTRQLDQSVASELHSSNWITG